MRVMGSHDISTSFEVGGGERLVAMCEFPRLDPSANRELRLGLEWMRTYSVLRLPPLGLAVERGPRETPQRADGFSIHHDGRRRELRSWRLFQERHELVREAGHRAADAHAAAVRATADAVHPPSPAHVALPDRTPAAQLDDALGRAGFVMPGEVGLLVVAAAIAPLVHRVAEEPCRPQLL